MNIAHLYINTSLSYTSLNLNLAVAALQMIVDSLQKCRKYDDDTFYLASAAVSTKHNLRSVSMTNVQNGSQNNEGFSRIIYK